MTLDKQKCVCKPNRIIDTNKYTLQCTVSLYEASHQTFQTDIQTHSKSVTLMLFSIRSEPSITNPQTAMKQFSTPLKNTEYGV